MMGAFPALKPVGSRGRLIGEVSMAALSPGALIEVEAIEVPGDDARRSRERELVSRARTGDLAAFEELYRENVRRVFAVCLRIAADPELAEELTQEAFVRAWRKLDSFRGDSAFSSWLHPLAVNVALSERRSHKRRSERLLVTDDLEPFDRPERATREPGTALDLERALATLPPGARAVFVLHDVEGWRHDEIAERTGIAVGTSKAQLHRARRLLREALER
jgi:RNA polymerase sigma-70 factor (ECF subfamily)